MRLVDANALKMIIEKEATFIDGDSVYKIIDLIDNTPTVEPKRPQGAWIRREDPRYSYDREHGHIMAGVSFHCSECDGIGDSSDAFCRRCGTPMKLPDNRI